MEAEPGNPNETFGGKRDAPPQSLFPLTLCHYHSSPSILPLEFEHIEAQNI